MTTPQEANRALWDERAPAHAASRDYHLDAFRSDPAYLSEVVRFDLPRLRDVRGLRGIHLQCHLGTDTLSLHRMGATMSGLDFSSASVDQARRLAGAVGADIAYHQADVYDAVETAGAATYDLVYTGVGALCWLPDVARWGHVVARLLRPGGRLFLRDGHPMLQTLADPGPDRRLMVDLPYFSPAEPRRWDEDATYVATDVSFTSTVSFEWNHGLGEIVSALLEAGLRITGFEEHDSVPWNALPGAMTPVGGGEWRLADRPERLPASFTLQAVLPG